MLPAHSWRHNAPEREPCLTLCCAECPALGLVPSSGGLVELVKEFRNNACKLMHATEDSRFTSNEVPLLTVLQMPHLRDEEIEAKKDYRALHSVALLQALRVSGEEGGPCDTTDKQWTPSPKDSVPILCFRELLFMGSPP